MQAWPHFLSEFHFLGRIKLFVYPLIDTFFQHSVVPVNSASSLSLSPLLLCLAELRDVADGVVTYLCFNVPSLQPGFNGTNAEEINFIYPGVLYTAHRQKALSVEPLVDESF